MPKIWEVGLPLNITRLTASGSQGRLTASCFPTTTTPRLPPGILAATMTAGRNWH